MKKLFFLIYLLSTLTYSQKQNNNWYFGGKAGVTFNTGSPTALLDSKMSAIEGCSSVSNTSGELLFYTNGEKVWNKSHEIMANGTGLHSSTTSTQAALIVQKPGCETVYYVFTVETLTGYGLKYSEVDLSLQSGLGEVTQKNVPLISATCEKVAAIALPDGYWIITHLFNSDAFYSFKLNSSGVNSVPVISHTGELVTGDLNYPGYLKASPKGDKIVCVNQTSSIELFDFNIHTGVVSNPKVLYSGVAQYGAEFSASGRLLYATVNYRKKIIQFNLAANDIATSQRVITELPFEDTTDFFAMQLGPDRKIYIAGYNDPFLSVIHEPEQIGVSCNLMINYINLEGRNALAGLPNFCTGYLYEPYISQYESIPKGISPNGDGINDSFNLTNLNVKEIQIFNRFGVMVFKADNYTNEWYGQSSTGKDLPDGVYFFTIKTALDNKTGWVYINR